jgi:molybdopterin converting factor small subunit
LLRWLLGDRARRVKVHVLVRGRIGPTWYDLDRRLELPVGTTLSSLIARGPELGIPFETLLTESPHLRDTLMLNGERCPVEQEAHRLLRDGDEIYLLAPLAGG